jgi:DNA-binding NarL/FixJ family response regulator
VLIADSQEVARIGIRVLLQGEPDLSIVGETGTVAETVARERQAKPDVILLESRFRDGSGAEACRLLLKANPEIRIVMMSLSNDSSAFHAAMKAGAHGYVLREIKRRELLHAIRVVAGGASYLHPTMIGPALSAVRDGSESAREPGLPLLSPQERRILPLVAEGKTNKEIAAELSLSEKTVKNYLANMFEKLQVTRRTQAVALYMRDQRHMCRLG